MKKFFSLFIFLLSLCYTTNAQQLEIDSLENTLSAVINKNQRSLKLLEICKDFQDGQPEVFIHFIRKAIDHNTKYKNTLYLANAKSHLGSYYKDQNQTDSAMLSHKQALNLYKQVNSKRGICDCYVSFALVLDKKRNFTEAIQQNLKALSCYEKINAKVHDIDILRAKVNIGIQYIKMNDHDKAEAYWTEALENPVLNEDPKLFTSVAINLSLLYRNTKRIEKSIKYGHIAEKSAPGLRPKSRVYSSLGAAYSINKEYDKGKLYFLKCLEIQKELNDTIGIQRSYHNIGYALKSQGKFEEATQYFLSSNAELKKRGDLTALERSYRGLSEMYEAQNKPKQALTYSRLRFQIHDSILGVEKQKAIADYEVTYQTEKAEREKELAELKSTQNRNRFIGAIAIAGLILLSALFYFSRMRTKRKAELINAELQETQNRLELEQRNRVSELKALKAQMNPHFIFNALNSIQDYILTNQKSLASNFLAKFADLIRNYLHFSNSGKISVTDEIKNLSLYLELEKTRFEEQLSYEIDIDESIDTDEILLPTMIIQPYIENALKHGLLHKKEDRKLLISLKLLSNQTLECIIEDNGIGREQSAIINQRRHGSHKSFALKATSERLELLNHGKDKKINVEIIDLSEKGEATGTRVIVQIPIL